MTSRVLFRAEKLLASSAELGPVMGLDTASPIASLAIASRGKILAQVTRSAASHCAQLPALVDELLAQARIELKDLNGIAVGLGPGSFTGLRVGLSYVKGLALALGCGVVGIPSFDCVALGALEQLPSAPDGGSICTIADARKEEVYAALYRIGPDRLEKISTVEVIRLESLFQLLPDGVILVGDSKVREASLLLGKRGIRSTILEELELNSRGRYVAALGAQRFISKDADSAAALEPLYVRSAEATFKPGAAAAAAKERPWSDETKSSSSSY